MKLYDLSLSGRLLCATLSLFTSACDRPTESAPAHASDAEESLTDTGYFLDNYSVDPNNLNREHMCPVSFRSPTAYRFDSTRTYIPSVKNQYPAADWRALKPYTEKYVGSDQLKITVIDIRRVNGIPHYYYYSNGGTQDTPVQPWSASKMYAFAMAADSLRRESNGSVGLDSFTLDNLCGGKVHIGDLITLATTYVHPQGCKYTSENISTWAQDISGRPHSRSLIRDWLGRPQGEDLSGGYGSTNSKLGSHFEARDGNILIRQPSSSGGGTNRLSTLAMAEFHKRIVMHREEVDLRLPYATWDDMKVILYGAPQEDSRYFAEWPVGGMLGGPSTYIHNGLGPMKEVSRHVFESQFLASKSRQNWRTYTKIGWGPANRDRRGNYFNNDFVWNGYACIPTYDNGGNLTNEGREFVISAALLRDGTRTDDLSDQLLAKIVQEIITSLMNSAE